MLKKIGIWMLKKIGSWIYNRFTLYHTIIVIFQLFGAFFVSASSPFFIRNLLLPSLVEYSTPLHFNFETCHDQLAGVCSFPTAVVDFSMENAKTASGENYEIIVEIVLSESTSNSNVGIFQAVVELVDHRNEKRTHRRSCFANRYRGLIYRISKGLWNLLCRTVFFPAYFFGLVTILDDHKLDVSFTNRLAASDLANTALIYVQLQNRFIEVESGKLFLRIRFGLLRVFLYNYPIISSLFIFVTTYIICLMGITLYWALKALLDFFGLGNVKRTAVTDETTKSSARPELYMKTEPAELKEMEGSKITGDPTSFIWNDLRRYGSEEASGTFLHRRQQSRWMKQ